MSGGDLDLGGPLKKPGAKGLDGKPLGGKSLGGKPLAGKPLGEAVPTPTAPSPAPPTTPVSFDFEDEPVAPSKKSEKQSDKKSAAPGFDPFADQKVSVGSPAAAPSPGSEREKPGTGRTEKPGTGRSEKPAAAKAPASDPTIGDIAPGLAKDLWLCPHCGAKNKPTRETCRECKKGPDEPVEKPWFMKPMIIGPVAGGLILVVLLFLLLGGVDLSLRPAGVMDTKVRSVSIPHEELDLDSTRHFSVKKTAAVSGRVISAGEYPMAPWLTAVVVGLGNDAKDDSTFSTWTAEFDGDGYKVKAPRYATLFLFFDGSKPVLKPGDYLSVVGKAGVPEQDHMIVKGTDGANCWSIKVEQSATR